MDVAAQSLGNLKDVKVEIESLYVCTDGGRLLSFPGLQEILRHAAESSGRAHFGT